MVGTLSTDVLNLILIALLVAVLFGGLTAGIVWLVDALAEMFV